MVLKMHPNFGGPFQAVSHCGRERRRRWLNDKLLQDMAGAMTAADMEALFKPPPFGQERSISPLTEVMDAENMPLW